MDWDHLLFARDSPVWEGTVRALDPLGVAAARLVSRSSRGAVRRFLGAEEENNHWFWKAFAWSYRPKISEVMRVFGTVTALEAFGIQGGIVSVEIAIRTIADASKLRAVLEYLLPSCGGMRSVRETRIAPGATARNIRVALGMGFWLHSFLTAKIARWDFLTPEELEYVGWDKMPAINAALKAGRLDIAGDIALRTDLDSKRFAKELSMPPGLRCVHTGLVGTVFPTRDFLCMPEEIVAEAGKNGDAAEMRRLVDLFDRDLELNSYDVALAAIGGCAECLALAFEMAEDPVKITDHILFVLSNSGFEDTVLTFLDTVLSTGVPQELDWRGSIKNAVGYGNFRIALRMCRAFPAFGEGGFIREGIHRYPTVPHIGLQKNPPPEPNSDPPFPVSFRSGADMARNLDKFLAYAVGEVGARLPRLVVNSMMRSTNSIEVIESCVPVAMKWGGHPTFIDMVPITQIGAVGILRLAHASPRAEEMSTRLEDLAEDIRTGGLPCFNDYKLSSRAMLLLREYI